MFCILSAAADNSNNNKVIIFFLKTIVVNHVREIKESIRRGNKKINQSP